MLHRFTFVAFVVAVSACTAIAGLEDLEFAAGSTGGSTSSGGGTTTATGGQAGSGGVAELTFTDDELDGEFGEGSFAGTQWADDRLQLIVGQPSGTFTSRVFDAGSDVSWTQLQWSPDAPYAKPLPGDGATETGYLEGNVAMTANALLLRLDGTGAAAHGDLLPESSGNGLSPKVWHDTQGSMPFVQGLFDQAISSTLDDHLYLELSPGSPLDFGTEDFAWALWVNTTFYCDSVRTWLGIEDAGYVHMWLGCKSAVASNCCPPTGTGTQAGGTFISSANDSTCYCGARAVDDGDWHHVMLVKTASELRLFVDGTIDSTTPASFENPMSFPEATRFTIGAFDFYPPGGSPAHQTEALFDEVAVWTRGFDDAEVAAVAKRGLLTLALQVRVCAEADCSDDPAFVGPDGSGQGWLLDRGLSPPAGQSLSGLPRGRYFQYQASFATRVAGEVPALRSVTVTAQP